MDQIVSKVTEILKGIGESRFLLFVFFNTFNAFWEHWNTFLNDVSVLLQALWG